MIHQVDEDALAIQATAQFPFIQGLEPTLRALNGLWFHAQRAGRAPEIPGAPPPSDLTPATLDATLQRYGITLPQSRTVATAQEAAAASAAIGFPVVLKIQSADISHKTEAGGVALGLKSQQDVLNAAEALTKSARAAYPSAKIDGFLVQEMVSGVETIVGAQSDPLYGPMLLIGSGGILVELVRDAAMRLLPVGGADVGAMIDGLKANRLLAGYRGKPAGGPQGAGGRRDGARPLLSRSPLAHRRNRNQSADRAPEWRRRSRRARRVAQGENLMDFELPEELRIFKEAMRRFVDNEMIPVEKVASTDTEKLKPEYYEKFSKRAKELGFWKMDIPQEYGGEGFSVLARSIVETELSRSVALPARGYGGITGPSVRAILYALTGEMKEKYLLPSLSGEMKACFAQTEPDAGSDPGGMRTVAVRDGDHYVINGVKRFISHAKDADFMQLMAATDRAKGSHGGISCFIVDMDTPGVKLTTQYKTMMGDEPWEIVLENVRVPASTSRRQGRRRFRPRPAVAQRRPRPSWRQRARRHRTLPRARDIIRQAAFDIRPAAGRSAIRSNGCSPTCMSSCRLGDCWSTRRRRVSTKARMPAKTPTSASTICDEMAFKAADMCMQIHGGIALTTDLPIEKMWRQRRSFRITEGATEVMKMVIARHVLKTYA